MIQVSNPRTGENDFEFVPPTDAELAVLAQGLRYSGRAWTAQTIEQRCEVLQTWKAGLTQKRAAIINALTTDTGRALISAMEFDGVIRSIDRWCALAPSLLRPEPARQSVALPSIYFKHQLVPYGLVGVISPWNFPLTLAMIDTIPALLAGCAVIIKPSEIAPRFADPLRETLADVPVLPLAFVQGAGETGAALIECADAICFTGSVKTGKLVAVACAQRMIPAFLELGGKDPVIVTASANIKQAAATVLRASVLATGQACQSLERVYVDEAIAESFIAELVLQAEAVTLNYPDIHCGQIGPLIFDKQADVIAAQLADAVSKGARVLTGGAIETHGGGKWICPTVLTNVNHTMTVMTEETFGPVLPVMAYRTADEAVALANDSEYGLSAAVIAGSLEEAEAIALQIEAGAVSLNDGALTGLIYEAEKHSFKLSGLGGSRMGAAGLTRFFRKKALLMQSGAPMPLAAMDEANAQGKLTKN